MTPRNIVRHWQDAAQNPRPRVIGEGGAGSGLDPDTDVCAMPTIGGPCWLPGDHEGSCEPEVPRCACSHGRSLHQEQSGRCAIFVCGCTRLRLPEVAS